MQGDVGPQGPQGPVGPSFGILGGGSGSNIDQNRYMTMYDAKTCDAAHESQCWTPLPIAGNVSKLYVSISADAGAANQGWRFTVRDNGVDTALTCDIVGVGNLTCTDNTDSVSFSAGDTFDVGITVPPGDTKPAGVIARYTAFFSSN